MSGFERKSSDIAVIGMACHLPEADSIEEFWNVLLQGKDCISRSEEKKDFGFVPAYGKLENVYDFDYSFFGFSKQEASMMDPQQRIFMQTVYEAMEDAGCLGGEDEVTGLFAGSDEFKYVWERILTGERQEMEYTVRKLYLNNSFVSRICYALDLTGPGMNLKAACATSLAAIHYGCQSLLELECDVCVAGGSSIYMPQDGYYHAEGTISSDGYTRTFDKNGDGFVPGNGTAAVVLKRLDDAERDKDHIYAVIRGSAVNNDGNNKASYSAPGINGEIKAMTEAFVRADISPEKAGYIECHGTATVLGDATEIQAMECVFGENRNDKCYIGSVKSNMGHLNYTAGVAAFIKTALMLKNKKIVPSINFKDKNEALEDTCLEVADSCFDWESSRRIAGVSSFGIGGTNCHIVLEEYPSEDDVQVNEDEETLILLSAKSELSLKGIKGKYPRFLKESPVSLGDIAFTLAQRRHEYDFRCAFAGSREHLEKAMGKNAKIYDIRSMKDAKTVFVFSGSSAVNSERITDMRMISPVFKERFDECCDIINNETGTHILDNIDSLPDELMMAAVFAFGYSAAAMWKDMGIIPDMVMGYSLGEYIAACFSGVIGLRDALMLCIKRAQLFEKTPEGGMLTVIGDEEKIKDMLNDETEISAINAPARLTVSGTENGIDKLKNVLDSNKTAYVEIPLKRGGHYFGVECICDEIRKYFEMTELRTPETEMISTCFTGKEKPDFTVPEYWAAQTRHFVDFKGAVENLDKDKPFVFLEIGMSSNLDKKIRKIRKGCKDTAAFSMFDADDERSTKAQILDAVGKMWCCGRDPDISQLLDMTSFKKASLPTYVWDAELCFQKIRTYKLANTNYKDSDVTETEKTDSIISRDNKYSELISLVCNAAHIEIENEDQSLFDQEIDSLSALVIATEIKNYYHIHFEVTELFGIDTIAELYDIIEQRRQLDDLPQENDKPFQKEKNDDDNTEKKDINDLLDLLQ